MGAGLFTDVRASRSKVAQRQDVAQPNEEISPIEPLARCLEPLAACRAGVVRISLDDLG
jgi:hypothetical protein